MLYRALHRLFGWDYIAWANSCDRGVARVFVDGTGAAYYWRYKRLKVADRIERAEDVLWLTCSPVKYGFVPKGGE